MLILSLKFSGGGEVPAIKAYDTYVKECLIPFSETCDDLGGLGPNIGKDLQNAWEGIRYVIVLASRAKAPAEADFAITLTAQLKQTQEAVQSIRAIKFARDYDRHYKAIIEMLACLSWVFHTAPKQLPVGFIKETLSSAEFWSNRIRKDYKGKDEKQIEFCDRLKNVLVGLTKYVDEYHKTGLTFNPRGVSIAEATIRLADEQPSGESEDVMKSPKTKRHPTLGASAAGVNIAGIMGELSKRKNADGSSAATGLKHVSERSFDFF
jgi:adenylyl cyclase-associated protein